MNIDFTEQQLLFIYGHFTKKIKELETIKSHPDCPIHGSNINADIKLYSSITDKISESYPSLKNMDKYL